MSFKELFLKAEKAIFYLFVFCLPWQTRLFLFGRKDFFNEWSSGFLYLNDLLLLALLFFWLGRIFGLGQKPVFQSWRLEIILGVFWLLAATSLFWSKAMPLSVYSFLKLTECLLLFFYLKYNFNRFAKEKVFVVFLLTAVFQSVVAVGQFFSQKSLGLKWLGESPLAADFAGVAKIDFWGQKIIRAYGTLPHPNLLGVFLLVALVALLGYVFVRGLKTWMMAPLGVLFFGLVLSFSRLAILAFVISFLTWLVFGFTSQKYRRRTLGILCLFLIFGFLTYAFVGQVAQQRFAGQELLDSQAVDLRIYYAKLGWEFFKQQPFGLGLGAFVPNFISEFEQMGLPLEPWMYQPAHNIYLLIAVELGFVGLVIFGWFLAEILRRILLREKGWGILKLTSALIFFSFLFLGFWDHYFWTLQQGQLIFWGVLGIMAGRSSHEK